MTDSKICIALDFKNKVEVKEFLEKISIKGQSYLFYVSTYGTTTGQSCQR